MWRVTLETLRDRAYALGLKFVVELLEECLSLALITLAIECEASLNIECQRPYPRRTFA